MKKHLFQFLVLMLATLTAALLPAFAQTPNDLPVLSDGEHELKGGEIHAYRISLTNGQFLYALVEQNDIDVITAVFAPNGKQLTESNSPNERWGTEPILLLAATPGDYRVEVRSANAKAPAGRYRIKIIALREASATDKGHALAGAAFDEARKLRIQTSPEARRAAIEKGKEALPLFEAAGDTYRRALTLLGIGIAYYQLNDFRTALGYFNQTLSIAVTIGDRRLEAGTETFVGGMLDILGDVVKALDHYHNAVKLAREGGWKLAEGNALSNIGKIYSDIAEWQKALEFSEEALTIFRAIGSEGNAAITLNTIATAYTESGEHRKAFDYLEQSLPILRAARERNPDRKSEAYTLLNMGRVCRRLNENKKALEYYKQALAIQRETGNRAHEAETLDEMGALAAAEGDYEKALELHKQAI
jgi:tetratricopeptide (TPR) repeat protein